MIDMMFFQAVADVSNIFKAFSHEQIDCHILPYFCHDHDVHVLWLNFNERFTIKYLYFVTGNFIRLSAF